MTDTLGLLIVVSVVAASAQDRDGAKYALLSTYLATPIRFVFADPAVSESMIRRAAINQMIRRLTRGRPAARQQRWRWPDTPE